MAALVVIQGPVVLMLPLCVEGCVAENFKFVSRLVSNTGAVWHGVPAVKDEIRFADFVSALNLNFALDIVFAAGWNISVSAVEIIGYIVAHIRTNHTCTGAA